MGEAVAIKQIGQKIANPENAVKTIICDEKRIAWAVTRLSRKCQSQNQAVVYNNSKRRLRSMP
jgi:uncharacterized protein YjaG (DUF416 family)